MEAQSITQAGSRTEQFRGHGGHLLAVEQFGAEADPALLFTHGFGQNRQAWRLAGLHLAEQGWHGLAADGRGHGDSAWSVDGHYTLDEFAADLIALATTRPTRPVLVGASMGGLLGLLAEGESSTGVFSAMVLVDVTPRWESAGVDRILAFMGAHPEGFASLEAAQAAIEAYLPHRERRDPKRLEQQLRLGPDGRWRWHWDPRLLQQVGHNGEQYIPRLLAASRRIKVPLLLLSGGRSDVVSARTIEEFRSLVPHAQHVELAEATHLVVGDRNDQFTTEIARFLGQVFPDGPRPALQAAAPDAKRGSP